VVFSTAVIGGVAAGGVASGNLKGAVKGSVMAAVTFVLAMALMVLVELASLVLHHVCLPIPWLVVLVLK